ncbi:uncharacterized protein B0P05DRAFT_461940 [Gilbertella persicaria]|uniref:uncharacterized protein n=1 Tax=Gilbertella persicaria TaxID=101096 RepID=UPI00221E8D64|nr:uncharacterized protein B0P05DRAFT_461940 [Gilbertella persicaria]KAI8094888.1 hypothetical protein B0P05DRAFT_461940 [Gilbertella persicaria]
MHASNKQVSIDLYMMGLDKLLSSLPVDSDPMLKKSLEQKLVEFKRRAGLVLLDAEEKTSLSEQQKALGGLSELVIHAAVLSAIAVKKSPLPGLAKAIELDQHTQAHQWVAQLFYLGSTAILKAGIAYAEAE